MMNKCIHGNYVPKGDTVAPNCSGCKPDEMYLSDGPRRSLDVILNDKTLDIFEYNLASVGDRLNDAFKMQNMDC